MKQNNSKIMYFMPLFILALVLAGCTNARPESEQDVGAPVIEVPGEGVAQPAPDTPDNTGGAEGAGGGEGATGVDGTGGAEGSAGGEGQVPLGEPTSLSVQPPATPTSEGGLSGTGGDGQPQPTNTPIATDPTPVPTSAPAQPNPSQDIVHVVQLGQNLFRIALSYGLDDDALASYNNIANKHLIYAGQKLRIPNQGSSTPIGSGTVYTVQLGDTLLSIAAKFNTTIDALVATNNLTNRNLIYAGQQLRIP